MPVRKFASASLALILCLHTVPAFGAFTASELSLPIAEIETPADAFSVRLPLDATSFRYSYFVNSWSNWQGYESDGDVGPGEESELIMLPYDVTKIRVEGILDQKDIHPITVSQDPVKFRVAATGTVSAPGVLSRSDWGADDRYLYEAPSENPDEVSDAAKGDNGATEPLVQSDRRAKDCLDAQVNYPSDFSVKSTVTKNPEGQTYRWPLQYSKQVKLLVVHHSALKVQGDPRPAVERVRALYKYHAINRGWGDIGYNFLVDENGQVYEGRQGGAGVIGGHAYCNNTGTIGIVVMGNFEVEQPSQPEMQGLQKLLASLASQYGLNVNTGMEFHGKKFLSPIVGHKDLLSTLCPGYYLYGVLGQVVSHVRSGDLSASIKFPVTTQSSSSSSQSSSSVRPAGSVSTTAPGITFTGRTAIAINPGGKQRLSFTYTADKSGAYQGKKVADITLSTPQIKLWQDDGFDLIPVTKGILLDSDLPAGESATIQLLVQAPVDSGTFSMDIAGIHFTLTAFGRRARTGDFINPFSGDPKYTVRPSQPKPDTSLKTHVRPSLRSPVSSSASSIRSSFSSSQSSVSSASFVTPFTQNASIGNTNLIRIKLSASASPTITFSDAGTVNGQSVARGSSISLLSRNGECVALKGGSTFAQASILRVQSNILNTLTIDSVRSKIGNYRGVVECRVIDNALVLINELSLEDYMAGLAEEPDSEPYEKQRAFAIAARTYAAFYLSPAQRKFPGKPYDGSDSPAEFQSYLGVNFTANNPRWLKAVMSTANEVMKIDGVIIKPPYFSSDTGRTRTPAEAGWNNFPFASIFGSKDDPWCKGLPLAGHGVGMSGCGAKGQAIEGRSAEQILQYYYPGVRIMEN